MNNLDRNIFIVSAPSGTGKTSLNRKLISDHPEFTVSVSYTTRTRRPQEAEGLHYFFVKKQIFENLVQQGRMLEWANVFGNMYGTNLDHIEEQVENSKKVILEIDVQGWLQAKPKIPEARSIFILPPSVKTLWERLENRGTEELASRWHRLKTAQKEISQGHNYEYFVVNNDFETAYQKFSHIILSPEHALKTNKSEGLRVCEQLSNEFRTAQWFKTLEKNVEKKLNQS